MEKFKRGEGNWVEVEMVEVKTGDFVLPGDPLATAEEFVPGDGVYEEGGDIRSSIVGVVLIDIRNKRISVFPRPKTPPILKPGDIVIGRVEEVRDQFALVSLEALRGKEDRELPYPKIGTLHISKVHSGFVRDLSRMFRPGDVVRVKVLSAQHEPVQLGTASKDLGVLLALCSKCREVLEKSDRRLKCPVCGNIESRKLAEDYRQGVV